MRKMRILTDMLMSKKILKNNNKKPQHEFRDSD